MLHQRGGLAEIARLGLVNVRTVQRGPDARVRLLFLRPAEEQHLHLRMRRPQLLQQRDVMLQRPAFQREVLRPARADVQAQHAPSGQLMLRRKGSRPLHLGGREINFHLMRGPQCLCAHQRQQPVVVLDAVDRVILRDGLMHEQPVQRRGVLVGVAHAPPRPDEAREHAVVNATLGVGVDGKVVAFAPQPEQERQRRTHPLLDQIFLMHGVHVRIALQQILRARPHDERVKARLGEVGAQLVQERRGNQRVADARHGNDQNLHSGSG